MAGRARWRGGVVRTLTVCVRASGPSRSRSVFARECCSGSRMSRPPRFTGASSSSPVRNSTTISLQQVVEAAERAAQPRDLTRGEALLGDLEAGGSRAAATSYRAASRCACELRRKLWLQRSMTCRVFPSLWMPSTRADSTARASIRQRGSKRSRWRCGSRDVSARGRRLSPLAGRCSRPVRRRLSVCRPRARADLARRVRAGADRGLSKSRRASVRASGGRESPLRRAACRLAQGGLV